MALTRWNKTWVIITLCSFAAYNIRWLYGVLTSFCHIFGFAEPTIQVSWWRFWVDYVLTGLVGDVIRLAGAALALFSVYLLWRPKSKPFLNVKKDIAVAVLFESIFFLTLLPITLIALSQGVAPLLMLAYTLQILLVSPVLMALSHKIWTYTEPAKTSLLKWAGVAALGYLLGIWVNNVFSWLNVAATAGLGSILNEITLLGFLNSLVTLSLSLIFAVAGLYTLLQKANNQWSTKLFALALIMLSLHFVLYILYSAITNTLNSVLLVEIWPITLLGLGVGMVKGKI